MGETIKSYKGFNKDMTCRGFQYEEGKEYETDRAEACKCGFHACEMPLDTFKYYKPSESIYHEVEQSGEFSKDSDNSKVASTKIKIGAKIGIKGLVKAQIDFIFNRVKWKDDSDNATSGYRSSAATSGNGSSAATSGEESSAATSGYWSSAATSGEESSAATSGYWSSAATSGDWSSAATSGDWSSAATSGEESSAATSGYRSSAATSGEESSAATSGDWSSAATSGYRSSAATSGNGSSAATSGDWSSAATSGYRSSAATSGNGSSAATSGEESSAATSNKNAIAVACGKNAKAKGVIGSYIVLTEWNDEADTLISAQMVRIDGENYKDDTFYMMRNGEIIEVMDD